MRLEEDGEKNNFKQDQQRILYKKNRTMKKLRFLKHSKLGEKDYVKRGNLSEISKILLVKLNMIIYDQTTANQ